MTPPRGATAEAVPASATLVPPVNWRIMRDVRVVPSQKAGPSRVTEDATQAAGATRSMATADDEALSVVVTELLADWKPKLIVCVPALGVVDCPDEV